MKNNLTPFEETLYKALLNAPGGLTHADILEMEVPKVKATNQNNKCAVHIGQLRKKLGINIQNVRGVGYKIVKN